MGYKMATAKGFQKAVMEHTRNAPKQVVNSTKDARPVTQFNGRTGEYARNLHIEAGGCANTSGDPRLVL